MLSKARLHEILGRRGGRWLRSPERYREYFAYALKLLNRRRGWCQGAYARNRFGQAMVSARDKHAVSWCGLGALERVTPEFADYQVCRRLLREALEAEPGYVNDEFPADDVVAIYAEDGAAFTVPRSKARIVGGYVMVMDALQAAA